jgi:uncharacterized membrane protein YoaK (UPF0700 family)
MFEHNPLKEEILQAKSRAQENRHQDGMDSLVVGARWLLALLAILVATAIYPTSSIAFVLALATGMVIDVFALEHVSEYFRRKLTYPRIGYVSVTAEPALPRSIPWYLKPLAVSAAVANGLWLFILFFSFWCGILLCSFGSSLVESFKQDVNCWPRHLVLFAVFVAVAVGPQSLRTVLLGIASVMVIYVADGTIRLTRFLRSHPEESVPSS